MLYTSDIFRLAVRNILWPTFLNLGKQNMAYEIVCCLYLRLRFPLP
jgi:hypothetical protein